MSDPDLVVGFQPDSDDEPAHFFIANEVRRVCCVPISGFEELNPDELPKMAAFMWGKLLGENECPTMIALSIATGWMECFRMQQQAAMRPPTLH